VVSLQVLYYYYYYSYYYYYFYHYHYYRYYYYHYYYYSYSSSNYYGCIPAAPSCLLGGLAFFVYVCLFVDVDA